VGSTPPPPVPHESDPERRRRLKENERRLRRLNLRIEELNRVGLMLGDEDEEDQAPFLCECSLASCTARLPVDVATYAEAHDAPDRFTVLPGHEIPDVERIVQRRAAFVVVEKV
jgi:hypothetical protein